MTTRTIGGWALLINALLTLFILIGMTASLGGDTFKTISHMGDLRLPEVVRFLADPGGQRARSNPPSG